MKIIIYSKNETIIHKNTIPNGIFLLLSGEVAIKANAKSQP